MFNIEATRHGSTKAGAIARAAAVAVVAVAVALHAKPEDALTQDRSTPIDLFVQTLFGADTIAGSLGDFAPQRQNNRLLGAIINS
jgi:hypothetical protein